MFCCLYYLSSLKSTKHYHCCLLFLSGESSYKLLGCVLFLRNFPVTAQVYSLCHVNQSIMIWKQWCVETRFIFLWLGLYGIVGSFRVVNISETIPNCCDFRMFTLIFIVYGLFPLTNYHPSMPPFLRVSTTNQPWMCSHINLHTSAQVWDFATGYASYAINIHFLFTVCKLFTVFA
jgi:hypothetical protein